MTLMTLLFLLPLATAFWSQYNVTTPYAWPESIEYLGTMQGQIGSTTDGFILIGGFVANGVTKIDSAGTATTLCAPTDCFSATGLQLTQEDSILAVVNAILPTPTPGLANQTVLVEIDSASGAVTRRIDLSPYAPNGSAVAGNDVAYDDAGVAYVTDSMNKQILVIQRGQNPAVTSIVNDDWTQTDPAYYGLGVDGIVYVGAPSPYFVVTKLGNETTGGLWKVNHKATPPVVTKVWIPMDQRPIGPDGLTLDPYNYYVAYVTGGSFVYQYLANDDWTSATLLQKIPVQGGATQCIFADGGIFVTSTNYFQSPPFIVKRFDIPALTPLQPVLPVGVVDIDLQGVAYDAAAKKFYVGDKEGGAIYTVKATDGTVRPFVDDDAIPALFAPYNMELVNGFLHVTNAYRISNANDILQSTYTKIDTVLSTLVASTDFTLAGSAHFASDVAYNSKTGGVFVSDQAASVIYAVTSGGVKTVYANSTMFGMGEPGGVWMIMYHPNDYVLAIRKDGNTPYLLKFAATSASNPMIERVTLPMGYDGGYSAVWGNANCTILVTISVDHLYVLKSTDDWKTASLLDTVQLTKNKMCDQAIDVVNIMEASAYINCHNYTGSALLINVPYNVTGGSSGNDAASLRPSLFVVFALVFAFFAF